MKKMTTKASHKTDDDIHYKMLESADARHVRIELTSDVPMNNETVAGTLIEMAMKICPDIIEIEEFEGKYH